MLNMCLDDDDPELEQVAAQLAEADAERIIEQCGTTQQLIGANPIVHRTRGTRIAFERDGGFLNVRMRFSYPRDAPIPPDGIGRGAWSAIHAFCAGMIRAAGIEQRKGRA